LCNVFIDEEKIFAIPNILKLHKHGFIVKQVDDYFKFREIKQFPFLKPKPFNTIKEDSNLAKETTSLRKNDVIKSIRQYID
jgi:hypothetical protein